MQFAAIHLFYYVVQSMHTVCIHSIVGSLCDINFVGNLRINDVTTGGDFIVGLNLCLARFSKIYISTLDVTLWVLLLRFEKYYKQFLLGVLYDCLKPIPKGLIE